MAQYTIKPMNSVFVVVNEDGEFMNDKMYKTERGAKQAITKAGHTYAKEPKLDLVPVTEAPKAPKADKPAPVHDLNNDQVLELFETAKAAALATDKPNWKEADRVAKEGGFTSFFALRHVVKGIRWSKTPEDKKAEIAAKREAFKPWTEEQKQRANKCARDNGFARYRQVTRAAQRGDEKAKLVLTMCRNAAENVTQVSANTGNTMPTPAVTEEQLLAQLAAIRAAKAS